MLIKRTSKRRHDIMTVNDTRMTGPNKLIQWRTRSTRAVATVIVIVAVLLLVEEAVEVIAVVVVVVEPEVIEVAVDVKSSW